jgi:NAD dependent epimerase/dehydratase family enzyme
MGNGRQWWSWIAIDDVVGLFRHALERRDLPGPINATAPAPVRNAEFARTLGRVLHRPALLPAPALALRLVLGSEMANALLLGGARVLPRRALETDYPFRFAELEPALRRLLGSAA